MISTEKVIRTKLYNSSRYTTFILVISSSNNVVVIVHKSINLSHSLSNYTKD